MRGAPLGYQRRSSECGAPQFKPGNTWDSNTADDRGCTGFFADSDESKSSSWELEHGVALVAADAYIYTY